MQATMAGTRQVYSKNNNEMIYGRRREKLGFAHEVLQSAVEGSCSMTRLTVFRITVPTNALGEK
jgi:hypothetical protein